MCTESSCHRLSVSVSGKKSYFPFGRIIWLGCLMASEECCSKFKLTLKKCFNQIFVVTICDQSCSASCHSNVQCGTEKWATIAFWNSIQCASFKHNTWHVRIRQNKLWMKIYDNVIWIQLSLIISKKRELLCAIDGRKTWKLFFGRLRASLLFWNQNCVVNSKKNYFATQGQEKRYKFKISFSSLGRYFFLFISLYIFSAVKQSKLSPFPPE